MESENKKSGKLKLNFFDILIIVIVIALAGGYAVYRAGSDTFLKDDSGESAETEITYTIEITNLNKDTESLIHKGDLLIDKVKKYELGEVQKVKFYPYERLTEDKINGQYVYTPDPEKESASLTVKVSCEETDTMLTADSGFELRVGQSVSVVGPAYSGAGYITSIERDDD